MNSASSALAQPVQSPRRMTLFELVGGLGFVAGACGGGLAGFHAGGVAGLVVGALGMALAGWAGGVAVGMALLELGNRRPQ